MYSNCLFEALKAKIKDPKDVRIIRLPKEINHGYSHYMWIKDGFVYHSFDKNYDGESRPKLLFSCTNKKIPLIVFQRWLLGKLAETKNVKKYAEKFDLPLHNAAAVKSYAFFSDDEECGGYDENHQWDTAVYEDVKKLMKTEPQIKVIENGRLSIVTFDELQKRSGTFYYKYITPYDVNFLELYPHSSKLESATILNDY